MRKIKQSIAHIYTRFYYVLIQIYMEIFKKRSGVLDSFKIYYMDWCTDCFFWRRRCLMMIWIYKACSNVQNAWVLLLLNIKLVICWPVNPFFCSLVFLATVLVWRSEFYIAWFMFISKWLNRFYNTFLSWKKRR